MEPLDVDRIEAVLHDLQAVARDHTPADVIVDIVEHEDVPVREQRGGLGAKVSEDHALSFLDRVTLDLHFRFEAISLGLVVGLLDALAGAVVHPAVVRTPKAALGRDAEAQVYAAVRALVADEAQVTALVA